LEGKNGQRVGINAVRHIRNKKSVALDLASEEGRTAFQALVKVADVVVENYRPGVMDQLGLGYDTLREINPRLVYASISGYGHYDCYDDSYRNRGMFDPAAQAVSGLMDVTGPAGGPPSFCGASVGDKMPATLAAYGILTAIMYRDKTGQGQHVDIAMYDSCVWLNDKALTAYTLAGAVQERGRLVYNEPFDVFRAKDGYIVIVATTQALWERMCQAMGNAELVNDPRLATPYIRYRNFDNYLKPIIEGWLADKTRSEAEEILGRFGVPAGKVQTVEDLVRCPQLKARGMLQEIEDPEYGKLMLAGNPVKLSLTTPLPPSPIPLVGQHTEEVLSLLRK